MALIDSFRYCRSALISPGVGAEDYRMKTLVTALILLSVLRAFSTSADEAVGSAVSKSTPPRIWTGFYAGLNAGGFWNNTYDPASINWSRLAAPGSFIYPSGFASVPQTGIVWKSGVGLVGGGQLGYSWQLTDRVVVGVETDIQGLAGGTNSWSTGSNGPSIIGSVRGRAGYLVAPNLQIYGTGGSAFSGPN